MTIKNYDNLKCHNCFKKCAFSMCTINVFLTDNKSFVISGKVGLLHVLFNRRLKYVKYKLAILIYI